MQSLSALAFALIAAIGNAVFAIGQKKAVYYHDVCIYWCPCFQGNVQSFPFRSTHDCYHHSHSILAWK
ncbi:MAG: hypothetical protein AAGA75_01685 [Cyanobacteria bacterium P01_E01_bin.6]